jgi:hypothetical protein
MVSERLHPALQRTPPRARQPFSGRYKSLLVDGLDDYYLRVVCDYVHLNPLRAGLLEENKPLETYPWISYPE